MCLLPVHVRLVTIKPGVPKGLPPLTTCMFNSGLNSILAVALGSVYSSIPSLSPSYPTGLKEAQDKVNDYNPLMKDFPVNELLAASSLESIQAAVAAIYTHLRKIRSTSYPAQRSIYLVESISRDLSTQLLKVCVVHVVELHCVCVCVVPAILE